MRCRLCEREAKLAASHIFPEFLYKALYDSKHRFFELSLKPDARDKIKQKGLRERLLCEPCEQKLSVYEGYVRGLLHGGVSVGVTPDGEHLRLSALDYSKLKLFQLSVLWRASISSLQAFEQVQLGPHEAAIQQMLLLEEPGSATDYGCIMSALIHEGEPLRGLIVPPTHARLGNNKAYRFVFGGLAFVYVVTRSPLPSYLVEAFAQVNGTAILRKQHVTEMGFLMNAFNELKLQGKLGSEHEA